MNVSMYIALMIIQHGIQLYTVPNGDVENGSNGCLL